MIVILTYNQSVLRLSKCSTVLHNGNLLKPTISQKTQQNALNIIKSHHVSLFLIVWHLLSLNIQSYANHSWEQEISSSVRLYTKSTLWAKSFE